MTQIDRRSFTKSGLAALALGTKMFAQSRGPAAASRVTLSDRFLKQLPEMMELAVVPGLAVAIVEKGRVSYTGEFGVANETTKDRITPQSVFPVGSLGKPVFAYGVMRLVEDGRLDLDRPLIEYLPGEIVPGDPRSRQITAKHVLSHSTGLQNWRFRADDKLQFSFAPGERWQYSGEGIFYLQRVVERITGRGLERFMQETVFRPLGMTSASYFWQPGYERLLVRSHDQQGQPAPYLADQQNPKIFKLAEEWKKPAAEWTVEDQEKAMPTIETRFPALPTFFPIIAAGTLQATIVDYAKLVIALLTPPSKGGLKTGTIDRALSTQQRINNAISWGLGWGLESNSGHNNFWHWGEGVNYRTFVIANRAASSAVIVFTNSRNGRKLWERIVTEATGADHPVFLWLVIWMGVKKNIRQEKYWAGGCRSLRAPRKSLRSLRLSRS